MKAISELLKDLEALKRKNGEGATPSPQSYKSYMEVFKAFVPTYNRIVEILEEIAYFDRVKYGRGATAARLTAGYSLDKEHSMSVSLNTNRYQREAVLSFRNGSEKYTMYPVEFSEFAGSNDNFFAIFTNPAPCRLPGLQAGRGNAARAWFLSSFNRTMVKRFP